MKREELLTAPQVARICSTDLKTIHNWVNKGEIKFFRTPGRHLRFRKEDVYEFLMRFGYPVPEDFRPERHRAMIIDSRKSVSSPIAELLSEQMDVSSFTDYLDALLHLGKERPSLVLLNCESGSEVFSVISRITSSEKGLPVVVYGRDESGLKRSRDAGATESIASFDAQSVHEVVSRIVGESRKSAS